MVGKLTVSVPPLPATVWIVVHALLSGETWIWYAEAYAFSHVRTTRSKALTEPMSAAIHDGSTPCSDSQRLAVERSPSKAYFARLPPFWLLADGVALSARSGPLPPLTVTTAPLLGTEPEPLLTVTVYVPASLVCAAAMVNVDESVPTLVAPFSCHW